MKLTVLVDNNTFIDHYFVGEPGFSVYLEVDGKNILFDLGYSDVFIKNANKMQLNLRAIDYVVLSHGHNDHTWGLEPYIRLLSESMLEHIACQKPTLVTHPDTFHSKLKNNQEIGCIVSTDRLSTLFNVTYSAKPLWLTENLVYLGEIERKFDFENQVPIGKVLKGNMQTDDYLMEDSALAYKSEKGLVIITGCSHSGICNIIEYAKKVCNEDRVVDVIGGFHLLNTPTRQLSVVVDYFTNLQPTSLHACHCTDLKAKIALSKVANLKEVSVGLTLTYE